MGGCVAVKPTAQMHHPTYHSENSSELLSSCPSGHKHLLTVGPKIIFHVLTGKLLSSQEHITDIGCLNGTFYNEKGEEGNWEPGVLGMGVEGFLGTDIWLLCVN